MKEDLKRSGIRQDGLEKRFDAFCKQVIKNAIYDVLRKEDRRQFFEQTGIDIPSGELLYEDEYKELDDISCIRIYEAGSQVVKVKDSRLDEILHRLSKRKQEVFVLGYGFNYSNSEMGYSQETLAALLYMKKTTICRYEKDEHEIPSSVIVDLV